MKRTLAFTALLFSWLFSSAQEISTVNKEKLENDPDFNTTAIPDKWKNESAVIICQKLFYCYDKKGGKIYDQEIFRKRIKLLDKNAVQEFSEFYFISSAIREVSIIKPNGEVKKVDLTQAVSVSESVKIPRVFKSSVRVKREYKKLAIPGLEVNDIIDYRIIAEEKRNMPADYEYAFPEVLLQLNNSYPAVKQVIEFYVEKGFNINFRNQNGAPAIKERSGPEDGIKIFYVEDTDRDKMEEERWVYYYRTFPTLKFQVIWSTKASSTYFLGGYGVPVTNITEKQILEMALRAPKYPSTNEFWKTHALQYMKSKYYLGKEFKELSATERAKQAYYHYRAFRYFHPIGVEKTKRFEEDEDYCFVKAMSKFLTYQKIKHTIVLAPLKEVTSLEDGVLKEEFTWLIKVEGEKPLFLFSPGPHSVYNSIPNSYAGVEAYEITFPNKKEAAMVKKVMIPRLTPEENVEKNKLEISIDSTFTNLSVARTLYLRGLFKDEKQNYLLYFMNAANEELNFYHRTNLYHLYSSGYDRKGEKKQYERNVENFKNELSENFTVESYKEYNVMEEGRGDKTRSLEADTYERYQLIVEESYILGKLIKKVGANYFLDAGKLIGGQVEITQKETERKYNVNYDPRGYHYEIEIKIPQGYTVEGLENLQTEVDNPTGTFKSNAKFENSILSIKTSKVYKNSLETPDKWKLITEFLNAAYKFSQMKVLIRKV